MQGGNRKAAWAAALLGAAAYAVYFSVWTTTSHGLFHTYAYDLGTFDQGIWLVGHTREWTTDWFVTVRGLHLLGDHVRLFSVVLAPLYWLADDVRALLVAQSVAIAAGSLFVLRIALREMPGRPWAALAFATAWLLHPAVQNLNLDHAHPDAFATTLLLAAVDALRGGRTGLFVVAAALAMSCKEDVPLVFVAMGGAMLFDPARRRFGAVLAGVAGAYFALCMFVILPHFNGVGFFRFDKGGFLAEAGSRGFDPSWLAGRLFGADALAYAWKIGAPLLFLFALAPLTAAPAGPAMFANLLSDASYMRSFDFHYQTSVVPFLLVACVDALAHLAPAAKATAPFAAARAAAATVMPFALLAAVAAANVAWSKTPLDRLVKIADHVAALRDHDTAPKLEAALRTIPADAAVSAQFSVVPHLSHRRRIYMFPNPFFASYWGLRGENGHDPETIDYVVLREKLGTSSVIAEFDTWPVREDFEKVDHGRNWAVYRRTVVAVPPDGAACGDWDGDGKASAADLRRIGRQIVRQRDCPLRVCDADGDGRAAMADVLLLQKAAVGEAATLLCPRS